MLMCVPCGRHCHSVRLAPAGLYIYIYIGEIRRTNKDQFTPPPRGVARPTTCRAAAPTLAMQAIPLVRRARDPPPSEAAAGGGRSDARNANELRPIKLRTGVVASASGSAMLELAHTKVLCSVFGPQPAEGRDYLQQGQLECSVRLCSFARRAPRSLGSRGGGGPARSGGTAEERALSLDLVAALSPSVQLQLLAKSVVAVHVLVLQDDGGALPAAVSCASLALADASISLFGLVGACSCAVLRGVGASASASDAAAPPEEADEAHGATAVLDGTASEVAEAVGVTTVACMPALEQLTLMRHEGAVTSETAAEALQLALSGCALLHGEMAASLRRSVAAAAEKDELAAAHEAGGAEDMDAEEASTLDGGGEAS